MSVESVDAGAIRTRIFPFASQSIDALHSNSWARGVKRFVVEYCNFIWLVVRPFPATMEIKSSE